MRRRQETCRSLETVERLTSSVIVGSVDRGEQLSRKSDNLIRTKKTLLKTTLAFLLSIGVNIANAQNYEWAKSFGGSSGDQGYSIHVDSSGNIYTTGRFEGTVDFDPGAGTANRTSAGSRDVFVQKLDASGNFLWAKSFGGSSSDEGWSIVDDSGNVYTTGYFEGTVDFNPGSGTANLTSAGFTDVFVQKLDASGNFLWAKSFGGSSISGDAGYSITVDASGNVYTTGDFEGTVDFDPGAGTVNLSSAGLADVFVQKLDASGNFLWAKSFGGSSNDLGYSITVDFSGNVYTTGIFGGTVDFDPGAGTAILSSAGIQDVFVQKLNSSGNYLWAKSFGGSSADYGFSITVDASGNVYTTGWFEGTADFDPGVGTANLTSAGGEDVFVLKLNSSGNYLWVKSLGGSSSDQGLSIAVDASGNIYTTGSFAGLVDFDPGAGTANLSTSGIFDPDVFIQKIDASGNYLWAKSFVGSFSDIGWSITVDASGNVYTTGYFFGTVDFDPGVGTANLSSTFGTIDVFVQKLSQCTNNGTDVISACGSYTWPANSTTYTSSGTYTTTLTNAAGCDSVLILNLTVIPLPSTPTVPTPAAICAGGTAKITPNSGGATYNFYATATGSNPLVGGNGVSSFTTPVLSSTTTYYIASVSAQGCESSTRTPVTVTVNPFPQPNPQLIGDSIACEGNSSFQISVANAALVSVYQWLVQQGQVISGQGTATAQIRFDLPFGNAQSRRVNLIETSQQGCISDTVRKSIYLDGSSAEILRATTLVNDEKQVEVLYRINNPSLTNQLNRNYELQRSVNLGIWQTVLNSTLADNRFSETTPTGYPQEAVQYRLRYSDACNVERKSSVHSLIRLSGKAKEEPIDQSQSGYRPGTTALNWSPYGGWLQDVDERYDLYRSTTQAPASDFLHRQRVNPPWEEANGSDAFVQTYRLRASTQDEADTIRFSWSNSLTLRYQNPLKFFNLVTANGDGLNETFVISNVQLYEHRLTILDRWGRTVLQTDRYNNDWSTKVGGTYFYRLDNKSTGEQYSGWVMVVE